MKMAQLLSRKMKLILGWVQAFVSVRQIIRGLGDSSIAWWVKNARMLTALSRSIVIKKYFQNASIFFFLHYYILSLVFHNIAFIISIVNTQVLSECLEKKI